MKQSTAATVLYVDNTTDVLYEFFGLGTSYQSMMSKTLRPQFSGTLLVVGAYPDPVNPGFVEQSFLDAVDFANRSRIGMVTKINVLDFRASSPKGLIECGVVPCSPWNRETIRRLAQNYDTVVAAWDDLHESLRWAARRAYDDLVADSVKLFCVGTTKAGMPCASLAGKSLADLVEYRWLEKRRDPVPARREAA